MLRAKLEIAVPPLTATATALVPVTEPGDHGNSANTKMSVRCEDARPQAR
jgi:hypothetical protein